MDDLNKTNKQIECQDACNFNMDRKDMSEEREEVSSAAKELVNGLGNDKAAPWIMLSLIGVICVALAYILSPVYKELEIQKHEGDKYIIDTFNNQLKNTTATIMKFDATLANVNNNLNTLKTQIEDTRTEQKNIRDALREYEKRITRLEIIQGKREKE